MDKILRYINYVHHFECDHPGCDEALEVNASGKSIPEGWQSATERGWKIVRDGINETMCYCERHKGEGRC